MKQQIVIAKDKEEGCSGFDGGLITATENFQLLYIRYEHQFSASLSC